MNPDNTVEYNSLSWVKAQLDDVLQDAQTNLNEYIENKTDEHLENCIEHLQLIFGTLQMVEVYGAAMLADEMQQTTTALLEGNIERDEDAYDVLMRAMLQLPDYLEKVQAGQKDAPITLMPLFNDLRAARKEGLLTESVLFSPELSNVELVAEGYDAEAIEAGKLQGEAKRLRTHYQLGLLDFIRNNKQRAGLQRIKAVLNSLEKVSRNAEVRHIWMVIGALVEGLLKGGIDTSLSIKMLIAAADRQLKMLLDVGEEQYSQQYSKELVKNVLYYVGTSTVDTKAIVAVKEAYHLSELIPQESDENSALIGGLNADLFDTVSVGITEDLNRVKDVLELFMHSNERNMEQLVPVAEQLGKIADTYGMLGMGAVRQSIMEQKTVLESIISSEAELSEPVVMNIASELLTAEAELKDYIASRSGFVDLNRKTEDQRVPASEYRQVVFTVVSEGLKNFSEAKEALLSYISGIGDSEQLEIILKRLEEVRGVAMMLPLGRVETLIVRLQDYIRVALLNNGHQPGDTEQDTVADVVTAIEYFFEALSEGRPGVEQGLNAGDAAADKLDLITQSFSDAEQVEAAETETETETETITVDTGDAQPQVKEVSRPVEKRKTSSVFSSENEAQYKILADDADEEIVEIFIEEAVEVLGELHTYLPQWKDNNNDEEALAVIRRSFHTLKGSGRLLGAELIGEFSWKFENILNRVIDSKISVSNALFDALDEALNVLPQLIEQLKGNREPIENIALLMATADAITEGREIDFATEMAQEETETAADDNVAILTGVDTEDSDGMLAANEEGDSEDIISIDIAEVSDDSAEEVVIAVSDTDIEAEAVTVAQQDEFDTAAVEGASEDVVDSVDDIVSIDDSEIDVSALADDFTQELDEQPDVSLDLEEVSSKDKVVELVDIDDSEIDVSELADDFEQEDDSLNQEDAASDKDIAEQVEIDASAIDVSELADDFAQELSEQTDVSLDLEDASSEQDVAELIEIDDSDDVAVTDITAQASEIIDLSADAETADVIVDIEEPVVSDVETAALEMEVATEEPVSEEPVSGEPAAESATETLDIESLDTGTADDEVLDITDVDIDVEAIDIESIATEDIVAGEDEEILDLSEQDSADVSTEFEIEIDEADEPVVSDIGTEEILDIDPVLRKIYFDESQSHIESIRQQLRECDENKCLQADKSLMRNFHTLYGSARTAEVEAIADLSGPAEKYIKARQDAAKEDIPEEVTAVISEVVDEISEMLELVSEGRLPARNKILQDKINKIVQQEIQQQLQKSWQENTAIEDVPAKDSPPDNIVEFDSNLDVIDSAGIESSELVLETQVDAEEIVVTDDTTSESTEEAVPVSYGDIDDELIDIFLEEAEELVENCEKTLAEIKDTPNSKEHIHQLQRNMHTLKGGARMAELTPIGDLTHNLESLVVMVDEKKVEADNAFFDLLQESLDALTSMLDSVKQRQAILSANDLNNRVEMLMRGEVAEKRVVERFDIELSDLESGDEDIDDVSDLISAVNDTEIEADVSTGLDGLPDRRAEEAEVDDAETIEVEDHRRKEDKEQDMPHWGQRASDINYRESQEQVRVRSDLLNNLVDYAGEVNIYHARMGKQISDFSFNLSELTQTVVRLKEQLRKLEIETEIQIRSGYEKESSEFDENFDPLEMDQYSTLQQLTRSLSETAADVDSINDILTDITRDSETLLLQESRVSTDLQEGLMRTRMVRFGGLSSRLRRIVRQISRELGKEVEVEISGESSEVDRTVLDRIIAPLEHMLRNAVAHGIELPEQRKAAGKNETGKIVIKVDRQGTDVLINVKDDGAGIDIEKVRQKAILQGFINEDQVLSDHDTLQLILQSGFSTADEVSQVAGSGVGMDVVDSEIKQLGGILDIDTTKGKGTEFHVRLPLTLAINQALLVSVSDDVFAVPLASIEGVVRITGQELQQFYDSGNLHYEFNGVDYELKHLGGMLTGHQGDYSRQYRLFPVLLVHVGDQHFALHVDDLIGRREIVVKPVGMQIGTVRGIAGATILSDGRVVLILEMSALAAAESLFKPHVPVDEIEEETQEVAEADSRKTIMVVDDSITIRKVTERMLLRYGIEVILAKDGVDATNLLQDHIPDLMLLDIEMPRMDGFEVASFVRNDERLKNIPIIMITSRTGSKHKEKAMEIGVNRYLGKPFQEDDLVGNINEILHTAY